MLAARLPVRSIAASVARRSARVPVRSPVATRAMNTIAPGVEFDTVAREWRMKWSADNDKASLAEVQKHLTHVQGALGKVPGVKSVQRVVCGGCLDYKVVIALDAAKFGDWEAAKFAPEEKFLNAVKSIPGVTNVETQTYTLMAVDTK
ncbi:hypothetical protein FOA52_012986 [Chlamydomonas sp. UWO 241]|nr:hypothetical protein FOA52_012986 [Chlamydomonas sp. UWO 241]